MQFFIGIVPPEDYKNIIIEFQQKWRNHSITNAVEPHLTLKAQGGLTSDGKWIKAIKKACNNFPSFDVSISSPKFFNEHVLYLSVESPELLRLHEKIIHVIAPSEATIKQYYELEYFVPHITLRKVYYGLSKNDLIEMKTLALKELRPYPKFKASVVRIYAESSPGKYTKYLDLQLKD